MSPTRYIALIVLTYLFSLADQAVLLITVVQTLNSETWESLIVEKRGKIREAMPLCDRSKACSGLDAEVQRDGKGAGNMVAGGSKET